jgi:hypothetical protein
MVWTLVCDGHLQPNRRSIDVHSVAETRTRPSHEATEIQVCSLLPQVLCQHIGAPPKAVIFDFHSFDGMAIDCRGRDAQSLRLYMNRSKGKSPEKQGNFTAEIFERQSPANVLRLQIGSAKLELVHRLLCARALVAVLSGRV